MQSKDSQRRMQSENSQGEDHLFGLSMGRGENSSDWSLCFFDPSAVSPLRLTPSFYYSDQLELVLHKLATRNYIHSLVIQRKDVNSRKFYRVPHPPVTLPQSVAMGRKFHIETPSEKGGGKQKARRLSEPSSSLTSRLRQLCPPSPRLPGSPSARRCSSRVARRRRPSLSSPGS